MRLALLLIALAMLTARIAAAQVVPDWPDALVEREVSFQYRTLLEPGISTKPGEVIGPISESNQSLGFFNAAFSLGSPCLNPEPETWVYQDSFVGGYRFQFDGANKTDSEFCAKRITKFSDLDATFELPSARLFEIAFLGERGCNIGWGCGAFWLRNLDSSSTVFDADGLEFRAFVPGQGDTGWLPEGGRFSGTLDAGTYLFHVQNYQVWHLESPEMAPGEALLVGLRISPCPLSPEPTGSACAEAGASLLAIKDKHDLGEPGGSDRDKLIWKWLGGAAAMTQANLAAPTSDTEYALCIYDGSPSSLAMEMAIPSNASGGSWDAIRDRGYKYRDPTASSEGALKVLLKSGPAGKPKAQVVGKGANLRMGSDLLPLDTSGDIVAQLRNPTTGQCWESVFPPSSVRRNKVTDGRIGVFQAVDR